MNVYHIAKGKIFHGDALDVLITLPDESVQCCVTSPPYWSLRDYNVAGQIGLEKTPEAYVEKLVTVFREVRRALKHDGTLWLNLGDTYLKNQRAHVSKSYSLKPKELAGIPWRVAFALQENGWYIRSDIIWHKSNAMPESVCDRPTKSHEYIFLLSKNRKYFYNADAIREAHKTVSIERMKYRWSGNNKKTQTRIPTYHGMIGSMCHPMGRNKRTVWVIGKRSFRGDHSATFPYEIPETCIKAGSRIGDVILDPFAGSGTTLEEAVRLGRTPIGIELNKQYIKKLIIPSLRRVS